MSFHSLVNTALFSEAANDFRRNGKRYTTAPRGSRDYFDYWELHEERCMNGYQVGDLWIPGRYYFYLNFFPMDKIADEDAAKAYFKFKEIFARRMKGERIDYPVITANKDIDFPRFTEVGYEWFMFKHIAWNGGEFMGINSPGGRHQGALKARGAGFSYSEASDGVYNFVFLDGSKSYYFAGAEDYLIKDGILNKVEPALDFINEHIPYWKKNRGKKSTLMHQKASWLDEHGVEQGIDGDKISEIIGVIVDNPNKAHPYSTNIYTPQGLRKWKDIQSGDLVFGSDGKPTKVVNTFEQGEQDIYNVVFEDGRSVQCTKDHLWTVNHWTVKQTKGKFRQELVTRTETLEWMMNRVNGKSYITNKLKVQLNECVSFPSQEVPLDPYFLGLMLGDGSIGKTTKNLCELTMKWDDVDNIKEHIPYSVQRCNWGGDIRSKIRVSNGKQIFKDLELFDKRSGTKFIPDLYKYNSKEVRLAVLNGLLDTDGSVTADFGVIEYCSKSEQLANDFTWLARSLGYGASTKSRIIGGTRFYRCYIYSPSANLELFNLDRKRNLIKTRKSNGKATWITQYAHVKSIELSHREKAKCIEVEADDHLYLVEDFVVTHNTRGKRGRKIVFEEGGSFKKLKTALEISLGSIRDGSAYVGQVSVFGTGGEEGPGIEGLDDIFNSPEAWDMLIFPNVWEAGMEDQSCGYFVPCWRVNNLAIDPEGNVDAALAIDLEKVERDKKKKSTDPKALDRRKAEYPTNPSEALMRLTVNNFPIGEIDAQIKRLRTNSILKGFLKHGWFVEEAEGPEFLPSPDAHPLIKYPHTRNDDLTGCVTIYEPPQKMLYENKEQVPGEIGDVYFITVDPVQLEDADDLTSLWAIYVWKNYNVYSQSNVGVPVAWYAGRPRMLEDAWKIIFQFARYYKAKVQCEIAGGGQAVYTYAKGEKLLEYVAFEMGIDTMEINGVELKKNRAYFMNVSTQMKIEALKYLINHVQQTRGYSEDKSRIITMHRIMDEGFLMEMKKFRLDRNADRISQALLAMLMLTKGKLKWEQEQQEETGQPSFYDRKLFGTSASLQGSTSSH